MTTTSRLGTFKIRLPEVIRTKKTLAVSNPTPKNERPPRCVGPGNTFRLNSGLPATSKYSIFVLFSAFTSVNTAPNPLTVADCVVPGIKKKVFRDVAIQGTEEPLGTERAKDRGIDRVDISKSDRSVCCIACAYLKPCSWNEEYDPARRVAIEEICRQQVQ
jgi:hypothetical protein